MLALLWWAWTGYAWLTSVIDPEEGAVRLVMFAAMAALLVVALSVPEAFGDRALMFAVAYGLVRGAHLTLFWIASREDRELRSSVLSLAVSSTIAFALLLGASLLDGAPQVSLWVVAIVLDFGGPALFGVSGWQLVPAHFAERHGLVIILALGESIVALGVGAGIDLTVGVVAAAVLGVALASAFWWTYFDVVSHVTRLRLMRAPAGPVRNAAPDRHGRGDRDPVGRVRARDGDRPRDPVKNPARSERAVMPYRGQRRHGGRSSARTVEIQNRSAGRRVRR